MGRPVTLTKAAELLLGILRGGPADHAKHMLPSSLTSGIPRDPPPNRARHQTTGLEEQRLERA